MQVMFSFLNTVAIVYRSTAALPFGTICIIILIWAAVTFPLTVLGGIAGKNSKVRHLPSISCKVLRRSQFTISTPPGTQMGPQLDIILQHK